MVAVGDVAPLEQGEIVPDLFRAGLWVIDKKRGRHVVSLHPTRHFHQPRSLNNDAVHTVPMRINNAL